MDVKPALQPFELRARKAGLFGFAPERAREFAQFGSRVNMVLPGVSETPMTAAVRQRPEMMAKWQRESPIERLGSPDELAKVILFLCSDAAGYMTGSTITVDVGEGDAAGAWGMISERERSIATVAEMDREQVVTVPGVRCASKMKSGVYTEYWMLPASKRPSFWLPLEPCATL